MVKSWLNQYEKVFIRRIMRIILNSFTCFTILYPFLLNVLAFRSPGHLLIQELISKIITLDAMKPDDPTKKRLEYC